MLRSGLLRRRLTWPGKLCRSQKVKEKSKSVYSHSTAITFSLSSFLSHLRFNVIAIDWGTSTFRAYRLDGTGRVVEARSSPHGIVEVKNGKFSAVLETKTGDWIAAGEAPVVMSGMIGSRQGWMEVPYAGCPAGFEEIAAGMRKVTWKRSAAWIAPGLTCRDDAGIPDVMRGEEVQILGVLDQLGPGTHTICLPGTHSKWVEVRDGRIERFSTHMTGEAFAVFKTHSLLGRMMKDGAPDVAAFNDGVRRSADAGGMLHHLFGVRTRGLFGIRFRFGEDQ